GSYPPSSRIPTATGWRTYATGAYPVNYGGVTEFRRGTTRTANTSLPVPNRKPSRNTNTNSPMQLTLSLHKTPTFSTRGSRAGYGLSPSLIRRYSETQGARETAILITIILPTILSPPR